MTRIVPTVADNSSNRAADGGIQRNWAGNFARRPRVRREELSVSLLREHLSYDSDTGVFTRLKSTNMHPIGSIAGTIEDGYARIRLFNVAHFAHRLAWFYSYGMWPVGFIDHIDGNGLNNRIDNLREATNAQNQHNRVCRGYGWNNKSQAYIARISVNGERITIGSFDDPRAAHAAYVDAHLRFHGDFSGYARAEVIGGGFQ